MNIILSRPGQVDGINALAEEQRANLIQQGQRVTSVASPEEQAVATIAATSIKKWLAEVEKNRKEVKAPVLEVGKRIDALAKEYIAPLETELNRLAGLVMTFQQAEAKRVAEAERQRQAAIAKAEADRKAAEALRLEAERKLSAEDAGLSDVEEATLAEAWQTDATKKVDEAIRAPLPVKARATGMIQREQVICFEVTDAAALYKVHPEWFELVPKRAMIRDAINKDTVLPGLRVWTEDKVGFRA